MALADTARLVAQLVLDDKGFSRGIDRAIAKSGTLDKTLGNVGKRGAAGLAAAAHNVTRAVEGIGAAGVVAIGASVKVAADFESQLNTINTVAQLTDEELAGVGKSLRSVARDTGTDLDDLTTGFYDLVSAGVESADAMTVLTAANTLAIGGLGTTAETIDLLTTAINSYGADASEATAISDKFAQAIAAGKVTAAELAESFATVGPIAASSGIEIDELAAGYAQLTAKGVPAAEASTQMRSAIVGLLSPNAKLNKIQKQTGKNFAEIAKERGLVVALQDLRTEADRAGVPMIDLIGRVEGFNFALATTGENLDGYNQNLKDVANSSGVAADQMSERQQGLNYQLARLKALAKDAGITVGSALLPKLTPLAEKAVAFLTTHESDITAFADNIAAGFDKALAFADRIPWGAIGAGLESAATWAGKLVDVFLAMPPEVQTTLIALAGLNKLSGGALSGIVSELGKGLIKGVLGITAGAVSVKAASVVVTGGVPGAGGVPVPGGGGATGKLGAAANLITKVAIVGIAADVASTLSPVVTQAGIDIHDALGLPDIKLDDLQWPFGSKNTPAILPEVFGGNGLLGGQAPTTKERGTIKTDPATVSRQVITNERLESIAANTAAQKEKADALNAQFEDVSNSNARIAAATEAAKSANAVTATNQNIANERLDAINGTAAEIVAASHNSQVQDRTIATTNQQAAFAVRDQVSKGFTFTGVALNAAKSAINATAIAARAAGQQTAAAVRDKDLSVENYNSVTVNSSISVRETINTQTTFKQYNRFIS